MDACKCGFTGNGPHPCHGNNYTCRQPATQRFYDASWVALGGSQTKLGARSTWACQKCWFDFLLACEAIEKIGEGEGG